jgi:hypothetical protein
MNIIIIIISIIIILLLLYIFLENSKYFKIIESYDNNVFLKKNGWDGIWNNKEFNLYVQFIQNNDKLIISLSNNIIENNILTNELSKNNTNNCPVNLFLGICQLDSNRSNFVLKEIKCSTYNSPYLNLNINMLKGQLNNNIITLTSTNKFQIINLTKIDTLTNNSNNNNSFLNSTSYVDNNSLFLNQLPIVPKNNVEITEEDCEVGEPCMDISNGLNVTVFNGKQYNACGKKTSPTNNICIDTPKCVFYSPSIDGLPTCSNTNKNIINNVNYSILKGQTKYNGNSLELCNYLNLFNTGKCNSVILFYLTKLDDKNFDIKTLSYEYFGNKQNESSLIVQYDYMFKLFNKNKSDDINKNTNKLDPNIWQINYNPFKNNKTNDNLFNSCGFTLNTSINYNTPTKYIEYSESDIYLSLYPNGINKQLYLENVEIIQEVDTDLKSLIILSANIRCNNGKYLIPSSKSKGFINNSTEVSLQMKPEENSKWFIFGLTLNNFNNIIGDIDNLNINK